MGLAKLPALPAAWHTCQDDFEDRANVPAPPQRLTYTWTKPGGILQPTHQNSPNKKGGNKKKNDKKKNLESKKHQMFLEQILNLPEASYGYFLDASCICCIQW